MFLAPSGEMLGISCESSVNSKILTSLLTVRINDQNPAPPGVFTAQMIFKLRANSVYPDQIVPYGAV